MDTINERIAWCIKDAGIKKAEFARRLNLYSRLFRSYVLEKTTQVIAPLPISAENLISLNFGYAPAKASLISRRTRTKSSLKLWTGFICQTMI